LIFGTIAPQTIVNCIQEVEALFLPPDINTSSVQAHDKPQSGRKSVKSHRLLMSSDIIAEKRELEERKLEKTTSRRKTEKTKR